MAGNDKKDSQYKARLLENVDSRHPINKGVLMQVHHLISEKAIKDSKVGKFLKSVGYDINQIHNLVALPSTNPGACHLEVQLHRGNHTQDFILEDEDEDEDEDDNDKAHPNSYHKFITKRLKNIVKESRKSCGSDFNALKKKTNEDVEMLSQMLLVGVANFSIPLTRVSDDYKPGKEGCRNTFSVPEQAESIHSCFKPERNHMEQLHQQNTKSEAVRISYQKKKYTLEIGK